MKKNFKNDYSPQRMWFSPRSSIKRYSLDKVRQVVTAKKKFF